VPEERDTDRAAGGGTADISVLDVLPDDVDAAAEEHAVLATPVSEPAPVDSAPLLEVSGLRTWFRTRTGDVHAVDGVDLTVGRGEVLGLVGESGSGKSVTMLSVLGLVDRPGRIVSGSVRFDGIELTTLAKRQLHSLRGNRISMVFQQPNASLHPCFNAARQISEVYEIHRNSRRKAGVEKAVDMLRTVGIPDPKRRAKSFPHQLSGGQAQRVMIAMALAAEPELLIADEPTTALDVTIQAQILDLMRKLQAERGTSVVLITHDLGVVAEMAHRVAVMYGGQIVEQAPVLDLFAEPKHPYTVGLLGSVPVIGRRIEELTVIRGRVPALIDPKPGCRFADRCPMRFDRCTEATPALVEIEPGRQVRCFLHSDAAVEENIPTIERRARQGNTDIS
jgi:oligopeptide/dipeptide ABC transporter ATP-binding protein